MGCFSSKQVADTNWDVGRNPASPETNIATPSDVQVSLPTGKDTRLLETSGRESAEATPPAARRTTRLSTHKARRNTVVGGFNPPEIPGLPTSANPKREFLLELEDLSSTSGRLSKGHDALNRTGQLTERTKPKLHGSFSDVSQAKLGDRVVAVKALRLTNIGSLEESRMWKRLGREIHVWAALNHPNVLEFLGFAIEDEIPLLISPWCENGTLKEYLQNFPDANRRRLVREIAEGLRYLHEQTPPIIHGDFKPTNVFVAGDYVAKINNFGSSRIFGPVRTGFTTSGPIDPTTRYSAPEILEYGADPTMFSNVFSFAYVALETLTDKMPFWRTLKDIAIVTQVVLKKETPSPEDHPGVEDVIWELLRKCWSYDPLDRPQMGEVCKMLSRAGYGSSTVNYPAPSAGPSNPRVRQLAQPSRSTKTA